MAEEWPADERREQFIRFLDLEARLEKKASSGEVDPALLRQMNDLLCTSFPRTAQFIEKSFRGEMPGGTREIEKIAWAESRSVEDAGGRARVAGTWRGHDIEQDIEECREVARVRMEAAPEE